VNTTLLAPASPERIPALAVAAECATCRAARTGPFCGQCGQAERHGRLTVRGIVTQAATSVVDLDRGFLHTAAALFRDPSRVIADYLAGRTVRYTNPAKYFAILVAAVVLVFAKLDYATLSVGSLDLPAAERVNAWITAHMNLFMAATVPFSALGSWWIFRRAGLNYAEHLVFNLYVYAQQFILFVVFAILGWAVGLKPAALACYTALAFAYYVWAARAAFGLGWRSALLRTLGLQLVNGLAGAVIGAAAAAMML
jgi:hypothetical protein